MAKKSPMPPVAFIGGKNKVKHRHVILIIKKEDAAGVPRKLELLLDDESVDVHQGMAFMTGYIPAHMIERDEAASD